MRGRPRARDLDIVIGELEPGPLNAITDVDGVRVGHCTLVRGSGPLVRGKGPVRTGVTAIIPAEGDLFAEKFAAACHVFNGFGKTIGLMQVAELGQLETPILLTNTLSVGRAADASVGYMVEMHSGIGVTDPTVNSVVAECNDGFLNDIGGRHVGEREVRQALDTARTGPVEEGNVGAGTGMSAFGWAGGMGTASRRLPVGNDAYTVGILVMANFGRSHDLTIAGMPVGRMLGEPGHAINAARDQGSVIVVIATDAPAGARQLLRMARRAPLGLARVGSHGGTGSGDVVIIFSTANRISAGGQFPTRHVTVIDEQNLVIDTLFRAVVESTEEAVINSMFAARTMHGRDGHVVEELPVERVVRQIRSYGTE